MVKGAINFYWLFRQAFSRYKLQIIALAIFGFIAGLLEGLGVNALIPLFSFALGDSQGPTDLISRQIAKFFALFDFELSVPLLVGFITTVFVLKAVFSLLLEYLKLRIITDYEEKTRRGLFEKFLQADWMHLIREKLGHLETILTVDVPNAATLLGQAGGAITTATGLAIYVFIAFNISAPITLITMVLGLLIFISFRPILVKIKILAAERNRVMKETAHFVSENILGMKTVKAMQVADAVGKKGRMLFSNLRRSTFQVPFLKSISNSVIEPIAVIFVSLIFAFTYRRPDFNLAMLIAIVYLIHRMFVYIQQFQGVAHTISSFSPYLASVVRYNQEAAEHREAILGKKPFVFDDRLEFDHVSFGYGRGDKVLSDVSFTLKKGQLAGLIGPSGVGKTTITDLLLRLLEPSTGQISLDGVPAHEINIQVWRAQIGYMSQDIFLLNDTIANNIRFYDPRVTDDDIRDAARSVNLEQFISGLPAQFETIIGERGIQLSGGERQRVVLARVLARRPQILILDEATSSLDNESEAQIQKVIRSLGGRVTVLVIAHRLSTIAEVDQMIVLDQGRVKEIGTPKTLLADADSYYSRMQSLAR